MTTYRKLAVRTERAPEKAFFGFTDDGSSFRSGAPIDNNMTQIARRLMVSAHADYLTPAGLVVEISRCPEFFRRAFSGDTMLGWARADRFHLWPTVTAYKSIEEWFRSQGGTYPWLRDEWAWTKACDRAESKHGHESRIIAPGDIREMLSRF